MPNNCGTRVTVPQLDGTFIEVETLVEPREVDTALAVVRQVLADLKIDQDDLTTERYDEMIRAATP